MVNQCIYSNIGLGLLFRGFVTCRLDHYCIMYMVSSYIPLLHVNSLEMRVATFQQDNYRVVCFLYQERFALLNLDPVNFRRLSCDLPMI